MPGRVTISIEIELGWGVHDLDNYEEAISNISESRKRETKALSQLLSLCENYHIPVTFDVVGHLLMENCTGHHQGPHPNGWFDRDPGTSVDKNPLFYAPDLVEMIMESDINHEICTHTFSHTPCSKFSSDVVGWEIDEAIKLHQEKLNRDINSMVPPRHSPPPLDILHNKNINVIRMPYSNKTTPTKLHTFYDELFGNHPVVEPNKKISWFRIQPRVVH